MNFKEIVMSRYAVKSFDGKKVDQKKVDEAANLIHEGLVQETLKQLQAFPKRKLKK
jgi:nitroreductase